MSETKTVDLPSGLKVKIRKAGLLTLQALETKDGVERIVEIVCRCTVEPAITADETTNGAKSIEEFDPVDMAALGFEIQRYSNLDSFEDKLRPFLPTATES